MVRAFFLSLAQLGDPAIRRVLIRSLGVTLAIFALAGVALWYAVRAAPDRMAGRAGGRMVGRLHLVVELLALWLAFRAVAMAVVGVFADDIVAAVEARHYPQALASGRPVSFARGTAMGLGSAARVIAVNLILLPLYIVLLVTASARPRRSCWSMAGCCRATWATWWRRGTWTVPPCVAGARRPGLRASCWGLPSPPCSWFRDSICSRPSWGRAWRPISFTGDRRDRLIALPLLG